MTVSVAAVIPTRMRPMELLRCLSALESQSVRPSWVVIAGTTGDALTFGAIRQYRARSGAIPVVYVQSPVAGAAHQRNSALHEVPTDATHVMFMDDDVVAHHDYIERLLRTLQDVSWSSPVGIAGVSTMTAPIPAAQRHDEVWRAFGLDTPRDAGRLLRSGVNVAPPHDGPPIRAGWLFGCALYSFDAVRDLRYCESFGAYALYDDVDFSLLAGRRGVLWVDPSAKIDHLQSDIGRPTVRLLSQKSVYNRWQLVSRHPGLLSSRAFWFSVLGSLLQDSANLVKHPDRVGLERLGGRLTGIGETVRAECRRLPAGRLRWIADRMQERTICGTKDAQSRRNG